MRDDQPGLRLRLGQEARRISSQHRQLDVLFGHVAEALQRREAGSARTRFRRLRDALEAHMALEEELYFPALHGLHPELAAVLTDLAHEHTRLRGQIERLARRFAERDLGPCAGGLERFADRFAEHERREESLPCARPPGCP